MYRFSFTLCLLLALLPLTAEGQVPDSMVTLEDGFVYAEPDIQSNQRGVLPSGQVVKVTGRGDSGYLPIESDRVTGWVWHENLKTRAELDSLQAALVHTFGGTGSRTTELFSVDLAQWKVQWEAPSRMTVKVVSKEQGVISTGGPSESGTTFIHRGEGTYYFKVKAETQWEILIWDATETN